MNLIIRQRDMVLIDCVPILTIVTVNRYINKEISTDHFFSWIFV
jgi:hypothetical protein